MYVRMFLSTYCHIIPFLVVTINRCGPSVFKTACMLRNQQHINMSELMAAGSCRRIITQIIQVIETLIGSNGCGSK